MSNDDTRAQARWSRYVDAAQEVGLPSVHDADALAAFTASPGRYVAVGLTRSLGHWLRHAETVEGLEEKVRQAVLAGGPAHPGEVLLAIDLDEGSDMRAQVDTVRRYE